MKVPGSVKVWVTVTQRPPWQMPAGHAVPSGLFFLHLPFLRRLQGVQRFFFATVGVRAVAPEMAMAAPTAVRREVTREWKR